MKLIINADDFGMDHSVNTAIVDAFSRGWISNTTVMTNMPGFPEAVTLAKEQGFTHRVGLHLNFMEGTPLTAELQADPLFVNDCGVMERDHIFRTLGTKGKFLLPKSTVRALQKEAEAQIRAYLDAGFTQMHLDSHCHAHTIGSVYRAIRPVVKKHGFRTMRKSLNFYGIPRKLPIRIYKGLFNSRLERNFLSTDYFSSAQEYLAGDPLLLPEGQSCELMVHPVYEDGKLCNKGGSDFSEILPFAEGFRKIDFSQLKKG